MSDSILKLDSAIYVISLQGKEGKSREELEQTYKNIAQYLTGNFKTYFEISEYQYLEPSGLGIMQVLMHRIGFQIKGIILGSGAKNDSVQLEQMPEVYREYLHKTTSHLSLPENEIASDSTSRLFVIRTANTSYHKKEISLIIDGKSICMLDYARYFVHELSAGPHTIRMQVKAQSAKNPAREINFHVVNGQDIYINCLYREASNFEFYGQQVNKYEAKELIQGLKRDKSCL